MKARTDLHSDAVTFQKYVAGDEIRETEFIDFLWLQPLAAAREIAVTRP
jgi:hypothetical protein